MMPILVFMFSLCLGVSKNLLPKFSKDRFSMMSNVMTANLITAVLALLIFGVQGIDVSALGDFRFIWMAVLYGLFTMGSQTLYIKAVKDGPVSICSMVYAFCFLVPTIIMALYFDEKMELSWGLGIILMLTSVALVVLKGESTQSTSKRYLIYLVGAMISAGTVGMLQKFFGHIYGQDHFDEFMFASFLFMLVYSLFGRIATVSQGSKDTVDKRFYGICLLLALSNIVASRLNLYLSAVLPATVFFPSINGATVFLSAVASALIFKERLSVMGWIGIVTGIVAILVIAT